MENEKLGSKLLSFFAGVLYVIAGVLMITNPALTLLSLSLLIGWGLVIGGIVAIGYAIAYYKSPTISSMSLVEGILMLLLGLVFLFGNFIASTDILGYLLVFWIIGSSALHMNLVRYVHQGWVQILLIILDIFIIVYAVILLFNPQATQGFLVFYVGFSFILSGIMKAIRAL